MNKNILNKDSFLSRLNNLPEANTFWIAYSGGLDSNVLLHLFYSVKDDIKQELNIVYVDHGLNTNSQLWAEFCGEQCQRYKLNFRIIKLEEACPDGVSIEAWAREQRYSMIAAQMLDDDILFTAHHQDDQVETFFLQALRGSGPRGLVAMPDLKEFINGYHARPLLNVKRELLLNYARQHNLEWQDDESNEDLRFERNFLRHRIMPELATRWPSYHQTIARLINHQKEYKTIIEERAREDYLVALAEDSRQLKLDYVKSLSKPRQKNLLFYWLDKLELTCPGSRHMENLLSELINASDDKIPCVSWEDVEVRRYKNLIYADKAISENDVANEYKWDIQQVLPLLDETLEAVSTSGCGISKTILVNKNIVVRYRQGGEKINSAKQSCTKTIKQLLQEKSVLPWYRDRVPLIYVDDELAVVPGFCVDKKFAADKDEASWDIRWSGYEKVVQSR